MEQTVQRPNQAFEGRNSSHGIYTRLKVNRTNAVDKACKSGHVFIVELKGCKNNQTTAQVAKTKS
jgi:hypothetical protein